MLVSAGFRKTKSNSFLLSEVTWDWDILEINKSKWHGLHTEKYSYMRLVLLSWSGICTIFLVLQVVGGPGR